MSLIRRFHQLESEHGLFELNREHDIPIWDIARYHAYIKYYYPEEERKRLATLRGHPLRDYFLLLLHFVRALFKILLARGENVVITVSRSRDANGEHFDKSALSVIEFLDGNCVVLEAVSGKRLRYDYVYDFVHVFRRFFFSERLSPEIFQRINRALADGLGVSRISYEELNAAFHNYQSDHFYYRWLFRLKGTKRVFIAEGNPKAALRAARDCGATTYLLQHGGIEFDEVDFSYPPEISRSSNILFADYVLTFGDYWCRGLNVPARQVVPIGNDFFYAKPDVEPDDSILVISTIIHGGELSRLTRELAGHHPGWKFVFKLHPNEFHLVDEYLRFFSRNENVTIVTDRSDVSILISRSQLVVLIVSAVLYEALNQHKKVAVYRRLNFERQLCVAHLPNVFFFDTAGDVTAILATPAVETDVSFYSPTDARLLRKVIAA